MRRRDTASAKVPATMMPPPSATRPQLVLPVRGSEAEATVVGVVVADSEPETVAGAPETSIEPLGCGLMPWSPTPPSVSVSVRVQGLGLSLGSHDTSAPPNFVKVNVRHATFWAHPT